MYFVQTADGIDYVKTLREAHEAAMEAIKFCRQVAWDDGEWPEEVESICYGRVEVRCVAREIRLTGDTTVVDYDLTRAHD